MTTISQADLDAAKSKRAQAITAKAETAIRASADQLDAQVVQAQVVAAGHNRAGAVAAGKPDAVIAANDARLKAEIAAEISAARAKASADAHVAAVQALKDAEAGVAVAARGVIDAEMIDMANEFDAAFTRAMDIGAHLEALARRNALNRPINMGEPVLPAVVAAALRRIPPVNDLTLPIDVLRNGMHSDKWAQRFAALTT